ncbi:hypothetical protein D9M69_667400 [compost metagenome]
MAAREPVQQLLAKRAGRTRDQQRAGGRRGSGRNRAVRGLQGVEGIEGHDPIYANFGLLLRR